MAKINVTFTTKEREFIERVLQEFLEIRLIHQKWKSQMNATQKQWK